MKIHITPLSYAIHRENSHPVFGEETTIITVEDEAAGFFFKLSQSSLKEGAGFIWLDIDELKAIYETAIELAKGDPK